MKEFKCGLCKEENRVCMTRQGLRKHLREEHLKKRELTNHTNSRGKLQNQSWWIEKEI